jgi:hypothetical protein
MLPRSLRRALAVPAALGCVALALATAGDQETGPRGEERAGPGITLLVSGGVRGELLPCGCVWAAKGGLSRRATVFGELAAEAEGDELVFVDLGNVLGPDPVTRRIEREAQAEDMRRLGYSFVAVGADDAAQGSEELRLLAEASGVRLLSANLVYHDSGEPCFEPFAILEGGEGPRVALLGLTRWEPRLLLAGERNRTVLVERPEESASRWIAAARRKADHVVIVGDLRRHEANIILREHPEVLAILTPGFNAEHEGPLPDPPPLLAVSDEGQQVLSFRIGGDGSTRAHLRTLMEEIAPDPEVEAWLQPVLDRINQAQREAHRETEPRPVHERFTGAEGCRACHPREYRDWSEGPHARAFETLRAAQREWFPECNLCHVTAAGDELVWLDPARTPQLAGVQCESCHDGGRAHAENPEPGYGAVDPGSCDRPCHRESADPDFLLEEAWQKLHHARSGD